ncbi:MAG: serine O-acetyltransferase [Ignavibacteria bacterium]|jgi:serine O-acetyltransferase
MISNNNIGAKQFSKSLLQIRHGYVSRFSVKRESQKFINDLFELLFPHFSEQIYYNELEIESKLQLLKRNLKFILKSMNNDDDYCTISAERFFDSLQEINETLWKDAHFINQGDPASESIDEVILSYPGFYAIAVHRVAHEMFRLEIPVLPRVLTEYAHQITGIDIHPGANIGCPFFIDHGTGVVVGETTRIGNSVKLYQGVTLGALSVDKKLAKQKRHPTIEDNVIIYSQAVILGGETVIGHDSIIGGNVWLTESVNPYSIVYHKSEVKVRKSGKYEESLDYVI